MYAPHEHGTKVRTPAEQQNGAERRRERPSIIEAVPQGKGEREEEGERFAAPSSDRMPQPR